MSVLFITNRAPHYRVPLFNLLSNTLGAEFLFHGDPGDIGQDVGYALARTGMEGRRGVSGLLGSGRYRAVICGLSGRRTLPSAYISSRRAKAPFILWASLWAHPRTPFHLVSALPARYLYRRSDAIVTYGPHVTNYVARYRGGSEGIFEAPQAVDNAAFSREVPASERQNLREELGLGLRPYVLFVGRVVHEKGVIELLRAWERAQRPNNELLVVAGRGPLEAACRQGRNVLAIGSVKQERLPVLYSEAKALVLPSIKTRAFLEPWGLVINEAMNQGLPVIASEAVGAVAAGLVRDGENGLVVPQRNPAALTRAIDRLLADESLRSHLGGQARASVARYSYEAMAAGFSDAVEYAAENAG